MSSARLLRNQKNMPRPAIATTEIGTVIAAAVTAVLLFDCTGSVGAGLAVDDALGARVGDGVIEEEEEEIVLVGLIKVGEDAVLGAVVDAIDPDGEADVAFVVDALNEPEVGVGLDITPSPRSQYLLNTSIAKELCETSCVQAAATCDPIMVAYLV